ncbi:MAG: cytosine permease [Corynebacterium sp.]|nr:cytosine permease [Corynebacterium sp.]
MSISQSGTNSSGFLSKVEQRGIEPVPNDQRTGGPGSLFWLWLAANISIMGIPVGVTLVALGLNFYQCVAAAAIGGVGSMALVAVVSFAGVTGAAPTLALSRRAFGNRGNIAPTFISLISQLGWETVSTVTATYALLSLCSYFFGTSVNPADNIPLTIFFILAFMLVTVAISATGHSFMMVMEKWATWTVGALTLAVLIYLVTTVHDQTASFISQEPGSTAAFIVGISTVAAGTGLGWLTCGADMSRYQKPGSKLRGVLTWTAVGGGIPLIIVITIGAMLSAGDSALTAASDPIEGVRAALPVWVAVPYLIAAVGGIIMGNSVSVYSCGLNTITMGLRVPRPATVVVDVTITTLASAYFLLGSDGFYGPFISFISLAAVPLCCWAGVFIVDWAHRHDYDAEAMLDLSSKSKYYFWKGIQPIGTVSWLIAMAIAFLFVNAQISETVTWFAGPLSTSWIGENGMAWALGMLIAMLLTEIGHRISSKA